MKTLTIKLKQHTPLIHFQHDQEGATLRASEVKPKLDRFLLTKLGKGDYQQGISIAKKNGWLIGKSEGHYALDYKIKIEAPETQIMDLSRDSGRTNRQGKRIMENIPLYFGDLGDGSQFKKMSFCFNPINLIIICSRTRYAKNDKEKQNEEQKETEIIGLIETNINQFFFMHNFGTRQTKGFGSFTTIGYPTSFPNEYAIFSLNNFLAKFGTWDFFKELFYSIELFYKTIRSGINQNGVYFKSLMYSYAIEQDSYWDKRTIRHKFRHFTPNKYEDKGEKADSENDGNNTENIARLFRDMLGLSSSQTWMSYNRDQITKEHIPNKNEETIERFKSPLLFKPVYDDNKYNVYIIPELIPEEYCGSKFKISSSNTHSSFEMKTPKKFDILDFLQYFTDKEIKEIVISEIEVIDDYRNKQANIIKTTLISIFKSLQYIQK